MKGNLKKTICGNKARVGKIHSGTRVTRASGGRDALALSHQGVRKFQICPVVAMQAGSL